MDILKVDMIRTRLTIPEDIVPDSYRWYQYIYTNLYKDVITDEARKALIEISKKLRDEHLICWTRRSLYPIAATSTYRNALFDIINTATDANMLRIALCLVRMSEHGDFFIDDYCLRHIPTLQTLTFEEV